MHVYVDPMVIMFNTHMIPMVIIIDTCIYRCIPWIVHMYIVYIYIYIFILYL